MDGPGYDARDSHPAQCNRPHEDADNADEKVEPAQADEAKDTKGKSRRLTSCGFFCRHFFSRRQHIRLDARPATEPLHPPFSSLLEADDSIPFVLRKAQELKAVNKQKAGCGARVSVSVGKLNKG